MPPDVLPPPFAAARSLMSCVQELDGFDPDESLYEGHEETKGFETDLVLNYLRILRSFLSSARARIIEARLPTFKAQLAVLAEPLQLLNDRIFLLEREPGQTPDELRQLLTQEVKKLRQWREKIVNLANELYASRKVRENQLYDIVMTRNGLDHIMSLYMSTMGIPMGTPLPTDLTRNSMIGEILDREYPPEGGVKS